MPRAEILEDIRQSLGFVPFWFEKLNEKAIESEWRLVKEWEMGETAIPNKYKELIGIGVAAQMQCPYNVVFHTEMARYYGATAEEIEDALQMAQMTAGWSAYLQGHQFDLDRFRREAKEMTDALAVKQRAS